MRLFKANHDLQICIDIYAYASEFSPYKTFAAQYICEYLTKTESGMSKLLKAVNEETTNLKQVDQMNALTYVLDKRREVSRKQSIDYWACR